MAMGRKGERGGDGAAVSPPRRSRRARGGASRRRCTRGCPRAGADRDARLHAVRAAVLTRAGANESYLRRGMLVSPARGLLTAEQARAMLGQLETAAPDVLTEVVPAAIGTAEVGAIGAFTCAETR